MEHVIRAHPCPFAVETLPACAFAVAILRNPLPTKKKDRGKAPDESILAPASGGLFTVPRSIVLLRSTDPADTDRRI